MNDNINEHSQIKAQAAIARLERFSKLTDSSIGIPFTKFNIGLEAVIGLIPVIGDAAGLILSSYVLIEAQRLGVSKRIKTKMFINMLIDFVGGLVPFFGDIFDAYSLVTVMFGCINIRYITRRALFFRYADV